MPLQPFRLCEGLINWLAPRKIIASSKIQFEDIFSWWTARALPPKLQWDLLLRIYSMISQHWISSLILICITRLLQVNSLCPSDAIRWHRSKSTLVQAMAFPLMAPSHHLNQCRLPIIDVLWHLPDSNLTVPYLPGDTELSLNLWLHHIMKL